MSIYATLAIIIATLNVAAFAQFGIDKRKARNDGWRIPDAVLLAIAGIGGGLGAHIGMLMFHNKTHHSLFYHTGPHLHLRPPADIHSSHAQSDVEGAPADGRVCLTPSLVLGERFRRT